MKLCHSAIFNTLRKLFTTDIIKFEELCFLVNILFYQLMEVVFIFILEQTLIKNINNCDKSSAYNTYHQIINELIKEVSSLKYRCRYVKNYLITLNTVIYMDLINSSTYKQELFLIRQNFLEKIEEQTCTANIVMFGEKMISFYIDNMVINKNMTENPIVNDAQNYIHNNLAEDLTLDRVSDSVHISKNYLSYLFPRYTGHSFSHYLRIARINKSKDLLVNTDLSLMDIALECGFNSQSYFCNVFKELEGMTPNQYRKHNIRNGNNKKPL